MDTSEPRSDENRSVTRIAYIGPIPKEGAAGTRGTAWLTIREISRLGVSIDAFLVLQESGGHDDIEALSRLPGVNVRSFHSNWEWHKWYSRHRVTQVLTGQAATAMARTRLSRDLLRRHRAQPFDLLYQYSTIETFGLSQHIAELPPLVLHPSTSAAGELRWLRKERNLAERCDGYLRSGLMRAWLRIRLLKQRRDVKDARTVIGLSRAFCRQFIVDYKIAPEKMTVVPNPVDLDMFQPHNALVDDPRRIAFVGRLAVRKGVEDAAELSHRLGEMAGEVVIEVVGGTSLWSNYGDLLKDFNPATTRYRGYMSREELAGWLPTCTCLIQPAKYEPFGLTVAEALACGVPVIATTAVGAAEDVSEGCAAIVDPSHPAQLERSVRDLLDRMASVDAPEISELARREAERLWSPDSVVSVLMEVFRDVVR